MTSESTASMEIDPPLLSVVIITENEADQVERCIESVFDACQTVPSFEVVLVDSASTDRTVELASEYPITVLRIPEADTVSCGAGRYVGDHFVDGEMVLHVDGDMELTETWLPRAIEHLEAEDDVAAIEGELDESTRSDIQEVDKVGGVMLYDAETLREVGGFDPYLHGYEDIDVGYRLRNAGYRLLKLPEVSATHHDEGGMGEPFRRWKQGYFFAPGQTMRKSIGKPGVLWRLVRRQHYKALLLFWMGLGAVALLSGPLVLGWGLLSAAGFGVIVARRGGVPAAIQFLTIKAFGVAGILWGVAERTPSASSYPVEQVEVLKEGRIHGGSTGTASESETSRAD